MAELDKLALPEWMTDTKLAGGMLGILSAMNILIEHLIAQGVADRTKLATLIEARLAQPRNPGDVIQADAARTLSFLLHPLKDEQRAATRRLQDEPPRGSA